MRKHWGMILGCLALYTQAETVNISGVVKSADGTPVASAIVDLTQFNLSDTTDASGSFAFAATASVLNPSSLQSAKPMTLHNGVLSLSVNARTKVVIQSFDLRGKLLLTIADQQVNPGRHSFRLTDSKQAAQSVIYKIKNGSQTVTILNAAGGLIDRNSAKTISTDITDMAKSMAPSPYGELKVTKTGFISRQLTVAGLTQTFDISLYQPGLKLSATLGSAEGSPNPPPPGSGKNAARTSENITPLSYKLALINFWFIQEDSSEINILNPDSLNPEYTSRRPLIIDFSTSTATRELVQRTTFPAGTYIGYRMEFTYMDMQLPVAFHVPSMSVETDYPSYAEILDTSIMRNFRLYYNAQDKFWKRDFVAELEPDSGKWFWLRRSLADQDGARNFFISVDANDHPPGGPGFMSTLDLFANADFWGPDSLVDDSVSRIYLGSNVPASALDCRFTSPFTIPAVIDSFYNIDVTVDISNTFSYGDRDTTIEGIVMLPGILDLGPAFGMPIYGDQGLHPFPPKFLVNVASSDTDAVADAVPSYQIPKACSDSSWVEPADCFCKYCEDNPADDFCVQYEASKK